MDDDIRDRLLKLCLILGGWLYLDESWTVTFADTAAFRRDGALRVGETRFDCGEVGWRDALLEGQGGGSGATAEA